ncbi:MAG: hypothetical protein KDD19_08125 [Phaeodactylibacter sp.]|nr:hypothetical protein [Phaeodactylibacter sp.]MCB9054039.1 hypothetical protein [Lewinellaceae bacterium]
MEEKKGKKKTDISESKNVIQDANIQAGGNVHIGDVYNYNSPPPAEGQPELEQIRALISKNKVEQAIESLMATAKAKDEDSYGEVQLLANSWKELQRQNRIGIVTYDQATTRRNQIIHNLLQIIRSLEKE